MIPFLASGLTFSEFENALGSGLIGLFGGDTNGLYLLGLFFLITFLYMMFRLNVGMEAGIVLGGFAIYTVTRGINQVAGGAGGLLPDFILVTFIVIGGFIIYLWLRRDVIQ